MWVARQQADQGVLKGRDGVSRLSKMCETFASNIVPEVSGVF